MACSSMAERRFYIPLVGGSSPSTPTISMTITTAFQIGEKAFYLHDNKVQCGVIERIEINILSRGVTAMYEVRTDNVKQHLRKYPEQLFPTKEALLASL